MKKLLLYSSFSCYFYESPEKQVRVSTLFLSISDNIKYILKIIVFKIYITNFYFLILFCNILFLLCLTICSSEMKRKGGHLYKLLLLQQCTSVQKKACVSRNFFIQVYLSARPFHKTLPRSRAFVNWISVRFYEKEYIFMFIGRRLFRLWCFFLKGFLLYLDEQIQ